MFTIFVFLVFNPLICICSRQGKLSFRIDLTRIPTNHPSHAKTTFYHDALKAGLYSKVVQVCYIPRPCDIFPSTLKTIHEFLGERESLEMRLDEI